MSSLALADVHLDLLYETDDVGLLLRSRDASQAIPLLHLVRTPEGNRWLISAAMSESERAQVEAALSTEPVIADLVAVESRPPVLMGLRPLSPKEERGPAFLFPATLASHVDGVELLSEVGNVATVPELAWIRAATFAQHPIVVGRNSAGEVVSVCHSARSTAVAAEAGVETAPDYRGAGLASAVVLRWAVAIRADGRMPLYSTQWTNQASRAVARKLGLVLYGEDYQLK